MTSTTAQRNNGTSVCLDGTQRLTNTTTLFHFTCLYHLPGILQEGITRGEVPIRPGPYFMMPQAPNLTRNPSPMAQRCWTEEGAFDKTRVRLTVSIPRASVTRFKQVRKEYRMRSWWVKALAPGGEHFDWYFAFDGVAVENIAKVEVALDEPTSHKPLGKTELEQLIHLIEQEKKRIGAEMKGNVVTFAKGTDELGFLLDGPSVVGKGEYPPVPFPESKDMTVINRA